MHIIFDVYYPIYIFFFLRLKVETSVFSAPAKFLFSALLIAHGPRFMMIFFLSVMSDNPDCLVQLSETERQSGASRNLCLTFF